MARVRVHGLSMSLDGYVAGPDQTAEDPVGVGGTRLHDWIFRTRFGQGMLGNDGGETGLDDELLSQRNEGVGATVMGRNMFGPVRGPWGDSRWTGWWGDEPPFHHPVFVLTHHPRPPIEMEGGTTFHFVGGGVDAVLEQALDAAAGKDVVVGGGASTIQQFLAARLIDELHLVIVPVLLGRGERLFDGVAVGVGADDYECVEHVSSPSVTHVRLAKVTEVTEVTKG